MDPEARQIRHLQLSPDYSSPDKNAAGCVAKMLHRHVDDPNGCMDHGMHLSEQTGERAMQISIPDRCVKMVTDDEAEVKKESHSGALQATKAKVRTRPILAKIAIAGLLATMSTVCASAPRGCDAKTALDKLDGIRASYTRCMQRSLATSAWRACTDAESVYQNKRLNAAYEALIAKLGPTHQAKLRSDERTWLRYRDALCTANPYGLEQPESANLGCTLQEDARRASYLESLVSLTELQG